jgi:signal peptide peptidase SppA
MAFQNIVNAVFFQPWCILPSAHYAIQKVVLARLDGVKSGDLLDEFVSPSQSYYVDDGIAFVPLQGVMGRKLSNIEKKCGGVDTREVAESIGTAVSDPEVSGIMILGDTPGGLHQGTPELATTIAAADAVKPVFTYVDGTLASAGVYATAGSRQIYSSDSSQIGSIGTYLAILDQSEAYAMEGLKVELFASGKFKGAGVDGVPLSDEQRENFRQTVYEANAKFQAWMTENRPAVTTDSMQGQMFWADRALEAGLIDAVAPLEQAIADLKTVAGM